MCPRQYSGKYPRLSRGRPGFDSPPGRIFFTFLHFTLKLLLNVPVICFMMPHPHIPSSLSLVSPNLKFRCRPSLPFSYVCQHFATMTVCVTMEQAYSSTQKAVLKFDDKKRFKHHLSLWRNRLARSTVNRKVGGSSPPRDGSFLYCEILYCSKDSLQFFFNEKDRLAFTKGMSYACILIILL